MAQTLVNIRMDEDLKKSMEETCKELGMNMTTAFTIFAKKVSREKRIPFEVSYDPFYSESNIAHIMKGIEQLNSVSYRKYNVNILSLYNIHSKKERS